jgi:hypothetical protein
LLPVASPARSGLDSIPGRRSREGHRFKTCPATNFFVAWSLSKDAMPVRTLLCTHLIQDRHKEFESGPLAHFLYLQDSS